MPYSEIMFCMRFLMVVPPSSGCGAVDMFRCGRRGMGATCAEDFVVRRRAIRPPPRSSATFCPSECSTHPGLMAIGFDPHAAKPGRAAARCATARACCRECGKDGAAARTTSDCIDAPGRENHTALPLTPPRMTCLTPSDAMYQDDLEPR